MTNGHLSCSLRCVLHSVLTTALAREKETLLRKSYGGGDASVELCRGKSRPDLPVGVSRAPPQPELLCSGLPGRCAVRCPSPRSSVPSTNSYFRGHVTFKKLSTFKIVIFLQLFIVKISKLQKSWKENVEDVDTLTWCTSFLCPSLRACVLSPEP